MVIALSSTCEHFIDYGKGKWSYTCPIILLIAQALPKSTVLRECWFYHLLDGNSTRAFILLKVRNVLYSCLVAISIVATTLTLYGCLGKLSQRHAQLISCLSRIFQREGHFVKGFFTRWTWSIKALGNTLYKCLSSTQNISIFLCTLYYQKNVPVRLLSFRNFSRG